MATILKIGAFLAFALPLLAQTHLAEIVRGAAVKARRSFEDRLDYTYTSREEVRRIDSSGKVRSQDVKITTVTPVRRHADGHSDFEFLEEAASAMHFRLLRRESIRGRLAYVIEANPAVGYRSRTRNAHVLSKVHAYVWIDEKEGHALRIEATVTEACGVGPLFARVQPGSRVTLEQAEIAAGVWMPARIDIRGQANIAFLFGQNIDRTTIYTDYHLAGNGRN